MKFVILFNKRSVKYRIPVTLGTRSNVFYYDLRERVKLISINIQASDTRIRMKLYIGHLYR